MPFIHVAFLIISQEPLYSACANNILLCPFRTPNQNTNLEGYADDTNIILDDDQSIIEALKLIRDFETATEASLNLNKTKVFGIDQWKGRITWPIANVHVQTESMPVWGITFSNNFEEAANMCWSNVKTRISNKIRSMYNRNLTLFQRSLIVNSLLTSQIWYYA